METVTPKPLLAAIRQFKHNNGDDGFVVGYDFDEVNRVFEALRVQLTKGHLSETQKHLLENHCQAPVTAKELAAISGTSRANAGGKLKDLYDKGYLSREVKKQPRGCSAYEFVYSLNE